MGIMDLLKRKKEEIPEEIGTPLPEELESFRTERPMSQPTESAMPPGNYRLREYYPGPKEEPIEEKPEPISGDKIEIILQKLETIDTRLKLIEEKLRR